MDKSNKVEELKEDISAKANKFMEEYSKLCEKHGFSIVANPAMKLRDDNTYSIVIQMQVAQLPKE